jgi:hypothetical protein
MLLVLIDINDKGLDFLLQKLFDLIRHLRIVLLGGLDSHLQLILDEINLGLSRIDSGILQ